MRDAVRDAVAAIAALWVPILVGLLAVVAWATVGLTLVAAFFVRWSPEQQAVAVWLVGLCAVAVWITRRILRPSRSVQVSESIRSSSVSPLARAVLESSSLPDPVVPVMATYGRPYAVWVASTVGAEALTRWSAAEVEAFAEAHHEPWLSTQPEQPSARQVAGHEAAHAVVAHHLGCTVTDLSTSPGTVKTTGQAVINSSGRTVLTLPTELPVVELQWVNLQVLVAGRAADWSAGYRNAGAFDDLHRAVLSAAGLLATGERPHGYTGELSTDALIAEASTRARSILDAHQDTVERVADALLEQTHLPGWELTDLLHTAIDQTPEPASPATGEH